MSGRPITEDDLQAFVDDVLDQRRRAEVEEHLSRHPELAERVATDSALRQRLRAALAPTAQEPIPPDLNLARMVERARTPSRFGGTGWRAVAAALLLVVGGAGGWSARMMSERAGAGIGSLSREARDSYAVYAPDMGRPVEIKAGDEAQLVKWTSKRLDRPMAVPDLSAAGYTLLGGRVVPTPHGPAALYMFDNGKGTRLVLLARNMRIDRDAPMVPDNGSGVGSVSWSRDGLGFSLVGPLDAAALNPLAVSVRSQVTRPVLTASVE